jgi:hypothetical protein
VVDDRWRADLGSDHHHDQFVTEVSAASDLAQSDLGTIFSANRSTIPGTEDSRPLAFVGSECTWRVLRNAPARRHYIWVDFEVEVPQADSCHRLRQKETQ